MKRYILIFILVLINLAIAQNFVATVNSNIVSLNDNLELAFTFSDSDINSITDFQPPEFKDFYVLAGPFQSTSMQIINGAVSGSKTFTYHLRPKAIGKFVIQSATIKLKGNIKKSNTINIEVLNASSNKTDNKKVQNENIDNNISENVFIKAFADKTTCYKEEQINVTYKLYTRFNISQPQISKLPSYPGFWSEEIESPQSIFFARENYDGKVFNVATIKKVALFPTETGELTITPFEMKIPVVVQKKRNGNNFFDDFFDDPFFSTQQTVEHLAKSNAIKIKVNELPLTNLKSFNGAVGSISFDVIIPEKKFKQNEPIDLSISIKGNGNIKLIQPPELVLPNGFETYDPKIEDNINKSNLFSGTKKFNYLLVPRISGEVTIPQIEFTYFDLNKKQYITLTKGPFVLNIEKGESSFSTSEGLSKDEIKILNDDIRFIKLNVNSLRKQNGFFVFSAVFWIFIVLLLSLFVVTYFIIKKNEKYINNIKLLRNTKAFKKANKELKKLTKIIKLEKYNEYYSKLYSLVLTYFEEKLYLDKSKFTTENLITTLRNKNIGESEIEIVVKILQRCEIFKYGAINTNKTECEIVLTEAINILIKIDNELNEI